MIVLIERFCRFDSHREINAGWVLAVQGAFPRHRVLFVGHLSHLIAVRKSLRSAGHQSKCVAFRPIPFVTLTGALRRFFRFGKTDPVTHLVSLSGNIRNDSGVYNALGVNENSSLYYVIHQEFQPLEPSFNDSTARLLDEVLARPVTGKRFVATPRIENLEPLFGVFSRKMGLQVGRKTQRKEAQRPTQRASTDPVRAATPIVLSAHVRELATSISGKPVERVNLPFSFCSRPTGLEPPETTSSLGTTLATIGNGDSARILRLLDALEGEFSPIGDRRPSFSFSAFSMNNPGFNRFSFTRTYVGGRISRKQIDRGLGEINFLVQSYASNQLKSVASGSMAEVFNYAIPHISIHNPQMELWHERYGQLGWMASSEQEWIATIIRAIKEPGSFREDWRCARKNLINARASFLGQSQSDVQRLFLRK